MWNCWLGGALYRYGWWIVLFQGLATLAVAGAFAPIDFPVGGACIGVTVATVAAAPPPPLDAFDVYSKKLINDHHKEVI